MYNRIVPQLGDHLWAGHCGPLSNTSLLWRVREFARVDVKGRLVKLCVKPDWYIKHEKLENSLKIRQGLMTIATIFEGTPRKLLEEEPSTETNKIEPWPLLSNGLEEARIAFEMSKTSVLPRANIEQSRTVEEIVMRASLQSKSKTKTTGKMRKSSKLASKRKAKDAQKSWAKRRVRSDHWSLILDS